MKEDNKWQLKIIKLLSKSEEILRRLKITIRNGSKILKKDPIFLIISLLSDHQQENLVTGFSEEDASNILNTVDLRKANKNDTRRPNIRISGTYIENYKILTSTVSGKASCTNAVKDNKKKILFMNDVQVRRIDRKKLQN